MQHPLSVAPMMDYTDRHFRYFVRLISRHILLYTEMITVPALLHGDRAKLLGFSPQEKPLALQLGGDDPQTLAECARMGEAWGYDEINLNVGCPSNRVQNGHFGACLMAQPERVAAAVESMKGATSLPVTVKHRIGIDDRDRYEDLRQFVVTVAGAGCDRFTIHARKAWLRGLDPKQNRTVPPLRYGEVYRLKEELPHLAIEINGGVLTLDEAAQHLAQVDAVMIGRAAYDRPYQLAQVDGRFYQDPSPPPTPQAVIQALIPYADQWVHQGGRLHQITRHILNLFAGQPGSRAWKRYLTTESCKPQAGASVIAAALAQVPLGEGREG